MAAPTPEAGEARRSAQQPGGLRAVRPRPSAHRPRLELLSMALGTALGFGLLAALAGGAQTDFQDLALGEETRSVYAEVEGAPIHCRSVGDASACIEGFRERGGDDLTLWLGNSQLHAVNQLTDGEENAPPILFRRLQRDGGDLLTFSQPNANLQEHLVLFTYLRGRLPVRRLLLPMVFDDLRESGLRGEMLPALDDPATREALGAHEIGVRILEDHADMASGDLAALEQTVQQHSEAALDGWLETSWSLWRMRPEARGRLFTSLHRLRNRAFGIDAQSVRRVIPGRYATNLAAAEALLADARDAGIDVLLYVVPLRDDVAVPYDLAQYAAFRDRVAEIAERHGAAFADLGSLVPAEHWGAKQTLATGGRQELDFMHFQAPGHALLAEALGELLDRHFLVARR